ncbi:MAG: bifunctional riboflavin kinase/FAD synthetase [Steroidobacteraceae bacterium]
MLITRGFESVRAASRGCVVAIGTFDGLHLGHQAILERLKSCSRESGLPAAVLTFEPNPREYLAPQSAPARLMRLRDKAEMLDGMGVSELRVLRFGAELSAWDGVTFIDRVLDHGMGAKQVVIGSGFRYGRNRSGDVALLRSEGARRGFVVHDVSLLLDVGGGYVSSTRVRAALAAGRLDEAKSLLGRDYGIPGLVIEGMHLGRKIGFPTANIRLYRRISPVAGVFAARVSGAGLAGHPGVAAVGTRPTVGGREMLLEVHLFDFDGDLYGQRLTVYFIAKLRDEEHYPDLATMTAQIRLDASQARELLGVKG